MAAFESGPFELAGPSWLDNERYVVEATVRPGASKEQVDEMLRNLLIDRFRIVTHREMRNLSHFELTLAKMGPKFRAAVIRSGTENSTLRDTGHMLPEDKDGFLVFPSGDPGGNAISPGAPFQFGDKDGLMHVVGAATPMRTLTTFLESRVGVGEPVIDKTGLAGTYDFNLAFSQGPSIGADAPAGPDIIAAVRDQLGLNLTSKKGPIEVLVIDQAEKNPADN